MKNNFGDLLKSLRESRDMKLKELESITGISAAYISQIERNIRGIPTYDLLNRLANALGISMIDFVKEIEALNRTGGSYHRYDAIPASALYIADRYMELPDKDKASLTDYLNFLIAKDKNAEGRYRKRIILENVGKMSSQEEDIRIKKKSKTA